MLFSSFFVKKKKASDFYTIKYISFPSGKQLKFCFPICTSSVSCSLTIALRLNVWIAKVFILEWVNVSLYPKAASLLFFLLSLSLFLSPFFRLSHCIWCVCQTEGAMVLVQWRELVTNEKRVTQPGCTGRSYQWDCTFLKKTKAYVWSQPILVIMPWKPWDLWSKLWAYPELWYNLCLNLLVLGDGTLKFDHVTCL